MKYRCKIELAAEVLSASLQAKKKTHIMNYCNLNSKQLYSYLNMLIASGLLNFDSASDSYTVSEKGRVFLRIYEGYKKHLLEMEKKLGIVTEKKNQLESMCLSLSEPNGLQVSVEETIEDKTEDEKLTA